MPFLFWFPMIVMRGLLLSVAESNPRTLAPAPREK
jgi:hypothetical protein